MRTIKESVPKRLVPGGHGFVLLILVALLLASSITRTLNFDEWLALRAGWLETSNADTNLNFLMPWTWALGIFSRSLSDPAVTVVSLRIFTASMVLWTLWVVFRKVTEDPNDAARTYLLCLASGVFISHGLEFRYDAAIVVLWLVSWQITAGVITKKKTQYILGSVIAILVFHHTKGAFFAASLSLYLLAFKGLGRAELLNIIKSGLLTGALWIALASTTSDIKSQFGIYTQFIELGISQDSVDVLVSLSGRIALDWFWWLVIIGSVVIGALFFRNRIAHYSHSSWFVLTPLAFILIHPRPWNYMLVPLIPILSYIGYQGLKAICVWVETKLSIKFSLTSVIVLLAVFSNTGNAIKLYNNSNNGDLHILSLLNLFKIEGDTVVDPAGVAYFIEPFDADWYADTLFLPLITSQDWMEKTQQSGAAPTFVVMSYRLHWVSTDAEWFDVKGYERACGWLYVKRGDQRTGALQRECKIDSAEKSSLGNFW